MDNAAGDARQAARLYKITLRSHDHIFRRISKNARISELEQINRALVEDFKAWRLQSGLDKKFSRGGRSIVLDAAILHRVFTYAIECELVARNPVKLAGRPGNDPTRGAQPFKATDLAKLRDAAGPDLLIFLLLRWTGMCSSDVVGLQWGEVDWESGEINRLTLKRRKRVIVPIHQELLFAYPTAPADFALRWRGTRA